jgi:6-phospho-beta-glucosidase
MEEERYVRRSVEGLCNRGGSTYTPELVEGIINRAGVLPVGELAFVDIDQERLEILGAMARRMFSAAGQKVPVTTTTDRRRAIEGADFVLNQIRVGGQAARIRMSTWPAARCGGPETTGPGGFANAAHHPGGSCHCIRYQELSRMPGW